ncbi:MAG: 2-oxo acid dehydrogenase subunit E2 [Actinobacteria bacterium]|nr:2-oxo acid dehydrogenase subunit E2 [Actinomycetota bacterium]MCL5883654.1 2-oxo acid dehydrogenase subunit E2 [Actinomycetota bacterium]
MVDAGRLARRRQFIHGLFEVDVTRTRQLIRGHRLRTGQPLSMTAYVAWCLAQAVDRDKSVQAMRSWGNRLVIFDDVDIYMPIEIDLDGRKFPYLHTLRNANSRTPTDLDAEIRAVKSMPEQSGSAGTWRYMQWFVRLPHFVRMLIQWVVFKNPDWVKQHAGTVELTAIGMFGRGGGWGIYNPNHTLAVVIGGVVKKPAAVDGGIEVREFLDLSVQVDHDIIDGGPAARFASQLREMIETGHGLAEQSVEQAPASSKPVSRNPA